MELKIIHTLPLFIRESSRENDLHMASLALSSLQRSGSIVRFCLIKDALRMKSCTNGCKR